MYEVKEEKNIKDMIYEIRGVQVMLDSDLAYLYNCKNGTKEINQAVKRNSNKFPERFCFKLNRVEYQQLHSRSQIVTLNNNLGRGSNIKYLPYVFTEEGIIMLASILKSETAVNMSIKIVDTFVSMRRFMLNNINYFNEVTIMRKMLLDHDNKINELFNIFDEKNVEVSKIFFEGQIYDAYSLLIKLIKSSKKRIVIIDNYIDNSILDLLSKKKENVSVTIITKESNINKLDIKKFNKQYPNITLKISNTFHDRFIILDDNLYHVGAP